MAAGGDAIHEMGVRIDEEADRIEAAALANNTEEDDYDEASLLELLRHIDRETESAEAGSRSRYRPGEGGFSDLPNFMRDPVIR